MTLLIRALQLRFSVTFLIAEFAPMPTSAMMDVSKRAPHLRAPIGYSVSARDDRAVSARDAPLDVRAPTGYGLAFFFWRKR